MSAFKRGKGYVAKFDVIGIMEVQSNGPAAPKRSGPGHGGMSSMTDDTVQIPLRRKDGSARACALLDPVDAHLAKFTWSWQNGYASRKDSLTRERVYMHRIVLGVPDSSVSVDHINRNRLDNRRSNLRLVWNQQQQAQNQEGRKETTSPYRGVSWDAARGKWRAVVKLNYVSHQLGRFDSEEAAAEVASAFRAKHMPFSADARFSE